MIKSDRVRDYARRTYIDPARSRKERTVRIVTGDVHKALGLSGNVPLVCSALRSKTFLEENGLELEKQEGPPSGQGTRVVLTYRLHDLPGSDDAEANFQRLRGIAKEVFRSLGGAEAFIRSERENFYQPESARDA